MRRIHIILAFIYGALAIISGIYAWSHLDFFFANRQARLFWMTASTTSVHYIVIWALLKWMKKDAIAMKSWYSIILPTIYSVIVGTSIEMNLLHSKLYNMESEYISISYLAIAVYFAACFPFYWHWSVAIKIKDALKQNIETQEVSAE
ncbi:MAG: hypothetical protein ACYC0V_19100 [Armatimonadota bacterium]